MSDKKLVYSEDEFERIESYLLGDMTKENVSLFETQLSNNEALRQKVDEVKQLILLNEEVGFREQLEEIHSEVATMPTEIKLEKGKKSWYLPMMAAASLALLIGFGTWWLSQTNTSKGDKVFAKYFVADPGLPSLMGESDQYLFDKAMLEYKQGNYESAITQWKQLASTSSTDTLNFYLGVAHLANDQPLIAVNYLDAVDLESSFRKDAEYYKAMAKLKLGELEEAKAYFQKSGNLDILKELE